MAMLSAARAPCRRVMPVVWVLAAVLLLSFACSPLPSLAATAGTGAAAQAPPARTLLHQRTRQTAADAGVVLRRRRATSNKGDCARQQDDRKYVVCKSSCDHQGGKNNGGNCGQKSNCDEGYEPLCAQHALLHQPVRPPAYCARCIP